MAGDRTSAGPGTTPSGSKIKVDNVDTISGQPSHDIKLRRGVNYAVVAVTGLQMSSGGAQPALTTVRYIVRINRPGAEAATENLVYLGVSKGTLSPVFRSEIKNYNVIVPYETDSLKLVAEALNPAENVIMIDGNTQESGTPRKIELTEGKSNVVRIDHYEKAGDPTPSSTYTVTIYRRAAIETLAELQELKLTAYDGDGTLIGELHTTSPFDPRDMNYYVKTPAAAAKVNIEAVARTGGAVSGDGEFILGSGFAGGISKTAQLLVTSGAGAARAMQGYSITFMPFDSVNPTLNIDEAADASNYSFNADMPVQTAQ